MSIELVANSDVPAATGIQVAPFGGATDLVGPRNGGWSARKIKTDAWLLAPPGSPYRGATTQLLDLLQIFPGESWQDRWVLFEATCDGVDDWHALLSKARTEKRRHYAHWTMELLVAWDVIRPSYAWMQQGHAQLGLRFLRLRDSSGLAEVSQAMASASAGPRNVSLTLNTLALIMARTGKMIRQLDASDLLGLRDFRSSPAARTRPGLHTAWRALKQMGIFDHESASMPIVNRRTRQRTPDELVDSYQLTGPLREPIVEYLRQRSVSLDHSSLRNLAYYLAKAFCGDLLAHHPDLDTFKLTREQATGWKERIAFHADGRPRKNHIGALFLIRAFYLDMAEWSVHDPYWLRWAAPSPISREHVKGYRKQRRKVISRMQQRTRDIAPFLDRLVAQAETDRVRSEQTLSAARSAGDGETIMIDGQPWTVRRSSGSGLFRASREGHPIRRLDAEEDRAFWTWALVETLRSTGLRMEEVLELTHLSVQTYKPPTGEAVPMLHISPSKSDEERLIVAGPELVHVPQPDPETHPRR